MNQEEVECPRITGGLFICSKKAGGKRQVEAATCKIGIQTESPAGFIQVGTGEAFPGSAGKDGLVALSVFSPSFHLCLLFVFR